MTIIGGGGRTKLIERIKQRDLEGKPTTKKPKSQKELKKQRASEEAENLRRLAREDDYPSGK